MRRAIRPISRAVLACSVLAVAALVTMMSLSQCRPDSLRDVVEPISIVDAMSWDDGGSRGLEFRDARGVSRSACLMDDLKGNRNLVVGSFVPVHDAVRLMGHPIAGADERTFLRLLERWCSGDADARWWDRRLGQHEDGAVDLDRVSEGSPSGLDAGRDRKAAAVGILRSLRRRNRS